jgi:Ca2+-binding RTX toxin-like protein
VGGLAAGTDGIVPEGRRRRRAARSAPMRLHPRTAAAGRGSRDLGRMRVVVLAAACVTLLLSAVASANTSHAGWPEIDGMLLMNKADSSRPLDARPGNDPFGGQDFRYSCDGVHLRGACHRRLVWGGTGFVVTSLPGHNELLGGHGNDTIYAGPWGDVLWGDYKPSGQPATQHDVLIGGPARDFIYASHGYNQIDGGGGNDWIKAHFGSGTIDCGAGSDTLYISARAQTHYTIRNCERISHKTLGY